ncbi:unnamed protein product [Boreogadus saida]
MRPPLWLRVPKLKVWLQISLRAFKRKSFDPEAKLDVVFVDEDDNGEGAVDEGGPTREYLRLLMRAVHQSNIFMDMRKTGSCVLILKIQEATTVREANDTITEAADGLNIVGALRHVSSLEEKDSLVKSAADFFVNGRLATALDQ